MLEEQHVTTTARSFVGTAERRSRAEMPPLAYKLDALGTWLFMASGVVVVLALIGAVLILSTTVDTLGFVSPQVESKSRIAVAVVVLGSGVAGAGIVAGLGGILKALIRRREL
jgi:hypothetical protein